MRRYNQVTSGIQEEREFANPLCDQEPARGAMTSHLTTGLA